MVQKLQRIFILSRYLNDILFVTVVKTSFAIALKMPVLNKGWLRWMKQCYKKKHRYISLFFFVNKLYARLLTQLSQRQQPRRCNRGRKRKAGKGIERKGKEGKGRGRKENGEEKEGSRQAKRLTKERQKTAADSNELGNDDEEGDDGMHYAERSPAQASICPPAFAAASAALLRLRIHSRLGGKSDVHLCIRMQVLIPTRFSLNRAAYLTTRRQPLYQPFRISRVKCTA